MTHNKKKQQTKNFKAQRIFLSSADGKVKLNREQNTINICMQI